MDVFEETFCLRVSRCFWDDHVDRGCVEDVGTVVVRRTAVAVTLAITRADVLELWSDASHYVAGGIRDFGIEAKSLIAAARSTLGAIERTFPDLPLWLAEAADARRAKFEAWRVSPEGVAQQAAADAVQAAAKAELLRHPSVNALREGDQLIDPSGRVRVVVDAWSSFRFPSFSVTLKFIDGTVVQLSGVGQAPCLGVAGLVGWERLV